MLWSFLKQQEEEEQKLYDLKAHKNSFKLCKHCQNFQNK